VSELSEVFAKGKKYTVDGVEYEAKPAMLKDMEEVGELLGKVITTDIALNFIKFKDEDNKTYEARKKTLYELIKKAFRGTMPLEQIKKLDLAEVEEILSFFLRTKRL